MTIMRIWRNDERKHEYRPIERSLIDGPGGGFIVLLRLECGHIYYHGEIAKRPRHPRRIPGTRLIHGERVRFCWACWWASRFAERVDGGGVQKSGRQELARVAPVKRPLARVLVHGAAGGVKAVFRLECRHLVWYGCTAAAASAPAAPRSLQGKLCVLCWKGAGSYV